MYALQVGYYSSKVSKLNTFQLMVAKYGTQTYTGFFYDKLQWSAGEASGGAGGIWGGAGGAAAYAGFTNGASTDRTYFNLAGSGTNSVLQLTSATGGTAADTIPGGLRPGQFIWSTPAETGCPAFDPSARLCGTRCIPATQCCAEPNDCTLGVCPFTGGTCVSALVAP